MVDLYKLQKEIYQNKVDRGFNVTNVGKEIILMTEELGELAKSYKNSDKNSAREISNKDEMIDAVGDTMIYCLGLCEMFGVNSEEVLGKIAENNRRRTHTGHI